jgi:NADH-ubiquinone oxidoreductase chain 1
MMVNFIFILIILLLFCLCCIIFVAFFTLFERIILASTQIRKGPNTVGILGLGQPFSDAIKLLFKELVIPYKINLFIFILSPLFMLFLSLFL